MNPYKNNYAWCKHVINYVKQHYLDNNLYNGLLFDCMYNFAPAYISHNGADINEDGQQTAADDTCYINGITYLLNTMRTDCPNAIITGNCGVPWPSNSPYYAYANGVLAQNAFGNYYGQDNSTFNTQWDYYQTATSRLVYGEQYYFLIADLRHDGRSQVEAENATSLTDEDKRRFRLALATTLLGDGYFGFDRGECLHGQLWWFKEYDVDLGSPVKGYAAPNPCRTDTYAHGTYSREFARGTVVVNPTGQALTVTFAEDRTDVSTGDKAKSFTLPANDGRIFIKVQ